jgi:hypothetical protein
MYKPRYFTTFVTGMGMLLRNTGGFPEGEGDVYTFLRVDFNFPFAEPNLERVGLVLTKRAWLSF